MESQVRLYCKYIAGFVVEILDRDDYMKKYLIKKKDIVWWTADENMIGPALAVYQGKNEKEIS